MKYDGFLLFFSIEFSLEQGFQKMKSGDFYIVLWLEVVQQGSSLVGN